MQFEVYKLRLLHDENLMLYEIKTIGIARTESTSRTIYYFLILNFKQMPNVKLKRSCAEILIR